MRRTLSIFLTLALLCLPFEATAAGALSVSDTYAGIATQAELGGGPASATLSLALRTPSQAEMSFNVSTDKTGKAELLIPGSDLQEAGTYTASVDGQTDVVPATTFTVLPASVDARNSSIEIEKAQVAPGEETQVVVILRDRFANPLSSRPVQLVSSRGDDLIRALAQQTDAQGSMRFGVTATQDGPMSLSAVDSISGIVLQSRGSITVGTVQAAMGGNEYISPYSADLIPQAHAQDATVVQSFRVTVPKTVATTDPVTLHIEAVDQKGQIVPTYTGTIYVSTPNDPNSTLPLSDKPGFGQLQFLAKEQGVKDAYSAVSFQTPGTQTIHISDSVNASIAGDASIVVTGPGVSTNGSITITAPAQGGFVNTATPTVSGKANPLLNLTLKGGKAPVQTESDANGAFSVAVPLLEGAKQATITIQDDQNISIPASVTFSVDTTGPGLSNVSFSPPNPEAGSNVLSVIAGLADTDIASITLDIAGQQYTYTKNPANPSLYQVTFPAPLKEGSFSAIVTATDLAGNATKFASTIVVGPKGLSQPLGLTATSAPNAVNLTWQPVDGAVDQYRVYVGQADKKAEDGSPIFDQSLDEKSTVPSAIVQGLLPGQNYVFAVTAVRGSAESQKSDSATAIPFGLTVHVTAGPSDLTFAWEFPNPDQLSALVLTFGTSADDLSETRVLDPRLKNYHLTDLLPGVTYFYKLTPIAKDGQRRDDLAAIGSATPTGKPGDFHPSAGDPIPFTPQTVPAVSLHPGATHTPGSGIPPIAWWAALGLTVLAYGVHRRRKNKRTQAFFDAMQGKYRSSPPHSSI